METKSTKTEIITSVTKTAPGSESTKTTSEYISKEVVSSSVGEAEFEGDEKFTLSPLSDNNPTAAEAQPASAETAYLSGDDTDDDFVDNEDEEEQEQFVLQLSKEQRWYDKLSMVIGIWNVIMTAYFTGGQHQWLPYFYTFKAATLLPFRYVVYNSKKWHYFMLDFCYYANLMLLLYIWVFPDNATLFMVLYSLTHGPLIWAVPLFGNALVFHSTDKMTSSFIHLSPPLVTHIIRFFLADTYAVCADEACEPDLWQVVAIPTAAFIVHEVYYFFVVGVVKRKKMQEGEYLTSFKFLQKHGLPGKVINVFGESLAPAFYVFLNGVYASLTIAPAYFLWRYYWLNVVFLCVMVSISLWNGASFYVEVFTRKHEEYTRMGNWDIKQAETKEKEKRKQKKKQ